MNTEMNTEMNTALQFTLTLDLGVTESEDRLEGVGSERVGECEKLAKIRQVG